MVSQRVRRPSSLRAAGLDEAFDAVDIPDLMAARVAAG